MKKVFIILIIAMLFALPVSANVLQDSDLSVGIGIGDSAHLTGRLDLDRTMAIVLNVGWGYGYSNGLYLRPQFQYAVSELEFNIDVARFYPYFGAALPVYITGGLDLGIMGVAGLSYYFDDLPMEVYGELLPGFRVIRDSTSGGSGFGFSGGIGVRWILGR